VTQATELSRSLLAQFENLAALYNPKFTRRSSVSIAKLLIVPSSIWKFGYFNELSIDSKMGNVWSKIKNTGGGSGGNPESMAMKWNARYANNTISWVIVAQKGVAHHICYLYRVTCIGLFV
jgi:hypothetical protein